MKDKYLTVTALTRYIKRKFETDPHLKTVWLRAEISNFKHHSRGHMYLTLKDGQSRVQAVMFSSFNRHLKFRPEDGMKVLIRGEIGVYEPHGHYQLYIHSMEPDGIGALYLALEQRKEKLEKEGLFSEERKRPIPKYPEHVGVITSPTGAAVRDIFTTLNRRFPTVQKTLIPATVQGDQAVPSIVQAIEKANEVNMFDVLIVGRGGGSIEELWGFNEEAVVRAIANSKIPIICGVGHETDFTISELAADMRAPTPTGAAELAVPSYVELLEKVATAHKRIERSVYQQYENEKRRLSSLQQSYAFRYPEQLMRQKELDLDRLFDTLQKSWKQVIVRKQEKQSFLTTRIQQQHPKRKIEELKASINWLNTRYKREMESHLQQKRQEFQNRLDRLSLLNPLNIIKRGYAVPYDSTGQVVKTVKKIEPGDQLNIKLHDGVLDCQVWGLKEENKNE
ncbi:exodeoxyribonuclease VII large subunit [Salirhabdus salicampi]|uniref:exodeoxyribonuclease VII large subunit n=1 Tax=Salirhabdus salicampi TaxID=476102 RepID=UPI0020C38C4F|nr:exodeoxyribonuclease VII large subunit [Salirhabdus salicampi]